MEVHHHSHPGSTETGKKWTHYFWEFLMLFLAVFCGFLAEYLLEHKIEKERGKDYIRSFYEDLKSDTASLTSYISAYEIKLTALKNAEPCYDSLPLQKKAFNPCIVNLINHAYGFPDLVTEDRTLIQLKNAGGLRLIKKVDADSILSYDRLIREHVKGETTGFQETQYQLRDVMVSLTNYANWKIIADTGSVPFLYADNPDLINSFFVLLQNYRGGCRNFKKRLEELKQKATTLVIYFKNKYHFQ